MDRLPAARRPRGQTALLARQLWLLQVLHLRGDEEKLFKCGLQVERGYVKAPRSARECELRPDWDWHRLVKGLRPGSPRGARTAPPDLARRLQPLRRKLGIGARGSSPTENFPGVAKLRRLLDAAPKNHWAGFQLFYPMTEEEVRSATGVDLVESMLAVFREVTPLMNLTMQIELKETEHKV